MQKGEGIGSVTRAALYVVTLFLAITAFFVPENEPVVYTGWLGTFLGLLLAAILLFSTYLVSTVLESSRWIKISSMALCAAILFVNHTVVTFSAVYVSAITLLWAHFSLLQRQYFTCFFFMAISAMFFAPTFWLFPLVILFLLLLANEEDAVRNLLKSLGGFAVPFILLLGVRYLITGEIYPFIKKMAQDMTYISTSNFSWGFPEIFLIVTIALVLGHAIILLYSKSGRYGIAEAYAVKTQCIYAIVSAVLFFLYAGINSSPVSILMAAPAGILLAKFFGQYGKSPWLRVEMILLLCALVLARLAIFIV
ncbi:MAG: hypothetical protein J6Z32_07760 [Bacteroidales bacterium]|nr:hypothetical protein [Bacteroidales bacterium]